MRFWIGIGIFVAVIVIAFALFVLHITGSPRTAIAPSVPSFATITDVHLSDTYSSKSGLHTIKGSATVPTPCTSLTATSTVTQNGDASSTDTIRIDLRAPRDTGICLTVLDEKSFSLSVEASKSAEIVVYANGALASTTDE
ncbi:MAG TPA: hypothetical protein VHC20_02705 [Candidatus Paceibacterota bacterium]|nr:hypothetical protein [Candidatus Paceibacterota bacterium]